MSYPITETLTEISIAYWSQPDSQILQELSTSEQLDAWRQAALAMQLRGVDGVDMKAFAQDLEGMMKGLGKKPSNAALMMQAKIVTGFRHEDSLAELKPEPMLVELLYGGGTVGYARFPDRPGRCAEMENSSDVLAVQWGFMPLLGAAVMEVFRESGRIEKEPSVLEETMLDFSAVGGEFKDGQLVSAVTAVTPSSP